MAQLQMRAALVAIFLMAASPAFGDDADADLTTPQLIAKYGYPAESHTVQTSDGYLLTLHRIPYGKGLSPSEKRIPILVQHGLMSSSADWVITGPGIAFAYLLADAGYDVWLGNARGTYYSRQHVSLDPDSQEFWQFSWHEMGVYDLPAVIDYILNENGAESLFYAGHSMGTTMFYVMASQRPDYNAKIRAMFSLAPIAYMSHMKSPLIQLIANLGEPAQWLLDLMGGFEFLPKTELISMIGGALCDEEAITSAVCSNAMFLVCGFDSQELDMNMMPAIMGHVPAGSSTMEFLHYGQEVVSGKFRQYDHGAVKNLLVYGQLTPPDYDLSKITAPVYLYYSDNDWLAGVSDVEKLYSELGGLTELDKVSFEKFNHLDFIWAVDGPELLYNPIIKKLANL